MIVNMGYNPKQTTWLNPNIEYLFGENIIEYDMKDAGFSLIKQFHLLPDDEIARLERIPKGVNRHIAVGCIERDNKDFAQALTDKFCEARQVFIDINGINSETNIIAVKKDAIFTIDPVKRTKFGVVEFAIKNRYSSYIRFKTNGDIELYYNDSGIDIKGIGDIAANRHRIYTIEWLRGYFRLMENKDSSVKRYLMNYITEFKAGELEDEYYLEFNSKSLKEDRLFNFRKLLVPLTEIVNKEVS